MSVGFHPSHLRSSMKKHSFRPALWTLLLFLLLLYVTWGSWSLFHPSDSLPSPPPSDLSYTDVSIPDEHGTLSGWLFESPFPSNTLIVLAPDYPGNRSSSPLTFPLIQSLLNEGFDVWVFDYRGTGRSGGQFHFGETENQSLQTMYDHFHTKGYDRFGYIGFSFGASLGLSPDSPPWNALVLHHPYLSYWKHQQDAHLRSSPWWQKPLVQIEPYLKPLYTSSSPLNITRFSSASTTSPVLLIPDSFNHSHIDQKLQNPLLEISPLSTKDEDNPYVFSEAATDFFVRTLR